MSLHLHLNTSAGPWPSVMKLLRSSVRDYKKAMTKEERRECKAYRHRFDNQYHNPTLIEEGLKAFAADCYEPLDRRDNGISSSGDGITYLLRFLL